MLANEKTKRITILSMTMAVVLLSLPATTTAEEANDASVADFDLVRPYIEGAGLGEDADLRWEPRPPGTIEGTGTYFEVTDSDYLNITFESSDPVHLILESVPDMVVMEIETTAGANFTEIALGGFEPSTTYYKYQDDYHIGEAFTTDEDGSYAYMQDLTVPHFVFIQSQPGTIFVPSDTSIGTWDPATRTYTLTTDVYKETIQIDEDNLTLDGAGHTIAGGYTGRGVLLPERTGVTVKNLNIQKFSYGITFLEGGNNTLIGNTALKNRFAIRFYYSDNNILSGNIVNSNNNCGIQMEYSNNNTLINNSLNSNNNYALYLWCSNGNTLTGNDASSNSYGIYVMCSSDNILSSNTMSDNSYNFGLDGDLDIYFDNSIDKSNLVDGKPIYYVKNAVGQTYDSYTAPDAGTFYAVNCSDITIKDLMLTNNRSGVFLWKTHNSIIENVTVKVDHYGICLVSSSGNTMTGNITDWTAYGISLWDSSDNILTGNPASDNRGIGIYLGSSNGNTLVDNMASNNHFWGIRLYNSNNNTLTGNIANSSKYYDGMVLEFSSQNMLIGSTANSNNWCGIHLNYSSNNILTGNSLNSNNQLGILSEYSNHNTFTGNTANSNNDSGIMVYGLSNTLADNTASSNSKYGIHITGDRSILSGNVMAANGYNFGLGGSCDADFEIDIDKSNLVDGRPLYYIRNAIGQVYDSSTNAGVFCAINCSDITIKDLTLTNNGSGVFLWKTHNSTIQDVDVSNSYRGIYLLYCNNNTLTNNTASNSGSYGIYLANSSGNTLSGNVASNNLVGISLKYSSANTLTGNAYSNNTGIGISLQNCDNNVLTDNSVLNNSWRGIWIAGCISNMLVNNIISNNGHEGYMGGGIMLQPHLGPCPNNILKGNFISNNPLGIYLVNVSDNQIYNNNFIDNTIQARVYNSEGNVFNLGTPTGGNFWSDWTCPDADGDGFVDYPYAFEGGQDNLPWVCQNGWVPVWIIQLIDKVEALNFQKGIDNSLDAKLNAALRALEDLKQNNDVAAINTLEAFISAVEAQRGKEIAELDADELIASALEIIAILSTE
jgi:parallel beta-helix repeat protein